jgi:methionyl-tRNA formyltransferase
VELTDDAEAGVIVESGAEGVVVACGQGGLRLTQLQKPGGKRLPVREFLAGSPIVKGQRFELREVAPGA